MNKKTIKIETDMDEMGIKVSVDNKIVTRHFEVEMVTTIKKLLTMFGIKKENYDIEDER